MRFFRVALAVIAVHVVDDSFVQPQPGYVRRAIIWSAGWPCSRRSRSRRGRIRACAAVVAARWRCSFGLFGLIAGAEAVQSFGATAGDDYTGLLAIPAGLALLGLGAATLWTHAPHAREPPVALRAPFAARRRRASSSTLLVVAPLSAGYLYTHLGRVDVAPANLGAAYERRVV